MDRASPSADNQGTTLSGSLSLFPSSLAPTEACSPSLSFARSLSLSLARSRSLVHSPFFVSPRSSRCFFSRASLVRIPTRSRKKENTKNWKYLSRLKYTLSQHNKHTRATIARTQSQSRNTAPLSLLRSSSDASAATGTPCPLGTWRRGFPPPPWEKV